MTIDPYSFCPCGNGKKFKFCKCVDQPQEYEKVVKLLEGGQGLAAIERLTQLLGKTPNAAWILALRGEAALALQEMEMYQENTTRFHALQPDNPLALTMKSIAVFLDSGEAQEAGRYLVDALAEAREAIPSLVPQAISVLLSDLARTSKLYLGGLWVALMEQLSENNTDAARLARAIPNTLARFPSQLARAEASAECKERLAEVEALTNAFQHRQAESKLTSILRDFPKEERALQLLLETQLILLDESGIKNTLQKLTQVAGGELKAVYQALFWALTEDSSLLASQANEFYVVDAEEELLEKLAANDLVSEMHDQMSEQVRAEFGAMLQEEVPPKAAYVLRDHAVQSASDAQADDSESGGVASHVALLLLFGKQTDKPCRLFINFRGLPADRAACDALKAALPLGDTVDCDLPTDMPYRFFLTRSRVNTSGRSLTPTESSKCVADDFLNYPINDLEGSPLEASKDEAKADMLKALMIHLECQQDVIMNSDDMGRLYTELGIDRLALETLGDANPLRVAMTHAKDLGDDDLKNHFLVVHNLRLGRSAFEGATELRSRSQIELEPALRAAMLSELLEAEPYESQISLDLLEEMEGCYAELKQPPGMIVMERVQRLIATGKETEAREVFANAMRSYPGDPVLMTVLQRSQGAMGPQAEAVTSNAILSRPKAEAETDGGIILPGQEPSSDESGESKLWLPGS